MEEREDVLLRPIEEEVRDSYLRYSMSVIISRALPDVRDGLKPSQRRILYAMRQLNLGAGAKHRKCAKICGDTSGDYHPHGETVIYPTLARMAQYWVMRYRLVDGQGNFGSVDGDPPAAMRYTEARLTHAAVALMEDLDKDTVDLIPNYDETKVEPTVMPARFPNLLCNGGSGIAVGMATNIPPHNFVEVMAATQLLLDDPQATVEQILEVLPGPDFPTGGQICGRRGIRDAYMTGKGKIIVRAKTHVEEMQGDRQRIVVDELPYSVNKATLVEHIADLIHAKQITGISDIRDESDKDGLRIVIELKRGEMPEVVLNQLYKFTDLQNTFGANMLALDKGMPRVMNIRQMLGGWIEHRIEVVRRRTRFELNRAQARAHILEGYLKAIDVLDEIVALIRASNNRDEARQQLMELFGFTERQANAVLDLRLYQLTGLEREKISEEHQALLEKIAYYKSVLADERLVRQIIREELEELRKRHGEARKTEIIPDEGEFSMEDLIADEAVIIAISDDDYIKRMPPDLFREQRRGGQGVQGMDLKKQDSSVKHLYVANTHDTLLVFTSLGRCYWIKVWQIPDAGRRSKGKPLIQLLEDIQPGERIATVLKVRDMNEERAIFMATECGVVKKTELRAFSNPRRKGIYAIEIDEGDQLIAAHLVHAGQQVMLFTHQGMAVRFSQEDVRNMGRMARGVKGVTLRGQDDRVVSCEIVNGDESILVVCENGFGKRSLVEDFRKTSRGGVGVRSIQTSDRNGAVSAALVVSDQDSVVLMSSTGQTVRISVADLRVLGRNTQGVRLLQLKGDSSVVAVQRLAAEACEEEVEV